MVIDCHYHLEEKILSIQELVREMDACEIQKTALIAPMVPPFREPARFMVGALQFALEDRRLRNIGRLFIANFTDRGEVKILGKAYPIDPDPDNAFIFETVRKYPDRFLGWVFVNPRGKKDPMGELEKYQDEPGFIGVKAHPFWHHFEPRELLPVAERLAGLDKPLLLHVGFGEEGNIDPLLDQVPGIKIILAHAGFPAYSDTWRHILHRKNVYLDLSQTSYTGEKATRDAAGYLGTDRLLYGTDGPYGFHGKDHRFDYGYIKRRIERMFPDKTVRSRILGGNLLELAGVK
jgi:uncharacterized protein